MKRKSSKIFLAALSLVLAFSMTACGGGSGGGSADSGSADGAAADGTPESLVVGISASPKPFNYQDEHGELTGLEVDMLNHIAEENNIDLSYEITEFESMFVGLDAGRYDLIIGNISKKPEREEKYLFSSEPYFKSEDRSDYGGRQHRHQVCGGPGRQKGTGRCGQSQCTVHGVI